MSRTCGLAVLAAALLTGCADPVGPPAGVLGRWDLVQRTCSFHNFTVTPETLGFTVTLNLAPSGRAEVLFGDSVVTSTTYQVRSASQPDAFKLDLGRGTFFGSKDITVALPRNDTLQFNWINPGVACNATLERAVS
jgi:hypothetical protein